MMGARMESKMREDLFEITELAHHGPENIFISVIKLAGVLHSADEDQRSHDSLSCFCGCLHDRFFDEPEPADESDIHR